MVIKYIFLILLLIPNIVFAACEEYPENSGNWYPGSFSSQSLTAADVSSCISAMSSGETIRLKAGTVDWSAGGVTVNKSINIIGAGAGCPVSCDNATTISVGTAITFTVSVGSFRISGITFDGAAHAYGSIYINAGGTNSATDWRIDHCHFKDTTGRGISVGTYASEAGYGKDFPGLIDNNRFSATNRFKAVQLYGGSLTDHGEWDIALALGGQEFVFIEDNYFVHTAMSDGVSSVDSDTGGSYVLRHNTIVNGDFSAHGAEECADMGTVICSWRSTKAWEIYDNTFFYGTAHSFVLNLRGGTGVIYNNTITGIEGTFKPIRYLYERGDIERTCLDDGACQGSSVYDGNQTDKYGYLCYHQIGTSGSTGITSNPVYQWSNTYSGSTDDAAMSQITYEVNCNYQHVQFGRDVILNGSTPKPGYAPYTYPHPLRNESQSGPYASGNFSGGHSLGGFRR